MHTNQVCDCKQCMLKVYYVIKGAILFLQQIANVSVIKHGISQYIYKDLNAVVLSPDTGACMGNVTGTGEYRYIYFKDKFSDTSADTEIYIV